MINMKSQPILRMALIALVAFFSTFSLSAQTRPAPGKAKPTMTQEQREQKRNDEMARELELTPDQKTKFEQTNRAYNEKMKAKRTASREELQQMREERQRAHKALLTREQAAKYDQMQAKKEMKQDGRKYKKADKTQKKADKMDKKAGKKGQKADKVKDAKKAPENRTRDNKE